MAERQVLVFSRSAALSEDLQRQLPSSHITVLPSARVLPANGLNGHTDTVWAIVLDTALVAGNESRAQRFLSKLSHSDRIPRLVTLHQQGTRLKPSSEEALNHLTTCHLSVEAPAADTATVLGDLSRLDPQLNGSPLPQCRVLRGRSSSLVTYTPRMFPLLDELRLVAKHDVSVLLVGETGSGKTYLSRLIHELSPRLDRRFLPLACGTLAPDLIESGLFGHVRGAFTGAHVDQEGKFSAAANGTILLDEIDILTLEHQAKLLRIIESGEYEPVGSNLTRSCEARMIVASNRPLEPLVESGLFREDLYYRLNVLKLQIPPLRERPEDLVPMAQRFIHQFASQYGIVIDQVDPEFYDRIKRHHWPGNIRELENAIRRAIILSRHGVLAASLLPPSVQSSPGPSCGEPETSQGTLEQSKEIAEKEVISLALRQNANQRTATARFLGISRVTLYNKMRKYGIATIKATATRD